MNSQKWLEYYGRICSDLQIDPLKDYESSLLLSGIFGKSSSLSLLDPYKNKSAYVIGNGPELEKSLHDLKKDRITIVADSALPVFMEKLGVPDIVVTDLDGDIESLTEAHEMGCLVVLHSHGDNMGLIREYAPMFTGNSLGTTQSEPLYNVFNFGGFTDGDRGAFLGDFLKSPTITLVAFDFDNATRKEGSDIARKKKKLKWARILLEDLAMERGISRNEGNEITL